LAKSDVEHGRSLQVDQRSGVQKHRQKKQLDAMSGGSKMDFASDLLAIKANQRMASLAKPCSSKESSSSMASRRETVSLLLSTDTNVWKNHTHTMQRSHSLASGESLSFSFNCLCLPFGSFFAFTQLFILDRILSCLRLLLSINTISTFLASAEHRLTAWL